MRLGLFYAATLSFTAVFHSAPASAIRLSQNGSHATLSGQIVEGDADRFRAFMARPQAKAIRVLHLNSEGGSLSEGIAIGKMVRKAKLATAVDGARVFCDSACTLIFAGGVRRHYVNGDQVYEGLQSFTGLGFHLSHTRGDRVRPSMKSHEGSARMIAFYAAMGVPAAAELCRRAAINTLFRPNGQTAMRLGIATSLLAPGG